MLEPILAGAILGGVFAVAARRHGGEGVLRVLGVGLLVAALDLIVAGFLLGSAVSSARSGGEAA